MSDEFTSALPRSVKLWYARAIAGAICSDGVVDDDEIKFLTKAITFLESKEQVYELIEQVKTRSMPELANLTGIERPAAFRMIATIVAIVANDGRLSKGEALYVRSISKKMGFSVHFTNRVIEWAKKSTEVRKEYSELRKLALKANID